MKAYLGELTRVTRGSMGKGCCRGTDLKSHQQLQKPTPVQVGDNSQKPGSWAHLESPPGSPPDQSPPGTALLISLSS